MSAIILFASLAVGQPAPATFHCPAPGAAKGEVKAGPPLVHTFDLAHNAPVGTVTITRVEAACGCFRQVLPKAVLQPGEKTSLTLDVNTLTQPDGPNRWQVVVGYKLEVPGAQPQNGEIVLQITATLSRDFTMSPPAVAFSTAGEASQTITVTDRRAKPFTVLKAASTSPHLTVEVGQPGAATAAGRPQSITLKLTARAPVGHRDETIVLYTDDPLCAELRVPVRVLKRAAAGVTATPETVNVRLAPGQTEVSTLVQLRSPDGKAVAVSGAESDHPGVQVKWSTGSGSVATVRVTVPDSVAKEPGRCTVRVRLSEPAGEVSIPVSWAGGKK